MLSDAQAKAIIDRKCGGCHAEGRGTATEPFSFAATDLNNNSIISQMRRSILRTGRNPMPRNETGFRDTAEGRQLIAWMNAKTGGR